tara:strand:+ start:1762 stop:2163 length:402 start_codon:yes stop_codon:yes gene_type:complete
MNKREKSLLKSLGVYIDPKINKKYNHEHADPEEWVRFYYYKNRKPFLVPNSNIRYESEVTSTNSLHRNTFYKMSHLSKTDSYYDYYYKLKEDVGSCIIKENKRLNKIKKKSNKKFKLIPPPQDENGKYIIKFE